MNTGLVGVWAVGWGQQKWCLNTVLKDELEFVTLGWAGGQRRSGWVEEPYKEGGRGRDNELAATWSSCVWLGPCEMGIRDHDLLDMKVPGRSRGLLGGVPVLPPGAPPSLPGPSRFFLRVYFVTFQSIPTMWFLYTSPCG